MIDALSEKRIGVIMGGLSAEREVSMTSGTAVMGALEAEGYDVHQIVFSGPDIVEQIENVDPDVVFLALHGRYGEDGAMQGLLEIMRVPYTGTGVEGSAIAMDKVAAKEVLSHRGIKNAPFVVLEKGGTEDPETEAVKVGYPLVVKPANLGSTIGMSFVYGQEELGKAVELAFSHDRTVLLEKFIHGRELTVGILGGRALPLVEIIVPGGVYDYEAKYQSRDNKYICPAELDENVAKGMQETALDVFRALKGYSMSRVDFRLDEAGDAYVLEMNTIPGLTGTSLLPKAAAQAGISFIALIETMLADAVTRYEEQA